jgi:hypothetical protein
MAQYTVTLSLSAARSRVLLTVGTDELMRAILPPTSQVQHPRAVASILEGLAMWLDRPPRVVVSADELDASFFFGLTDELGLPCNSVYRSVEVVTPPVRRPRGRRIDRLGDFRDLRQLSLLAGGSR